MATKLVTVGLAAFALGVTLAGTASPATAATHLVELFTSEGCSSCPPADRFATELAQDRGDTLVLAYHITYWDQLGWRDPYALPASTMRQRRYAALLDLPDVYTPQMIIDGRHDVVGSDRTGALALLDRPATAKDADGIMLHRDGDHDRIDLPAGHGRGSVWLVGFDRHHMTSIGGGENAGRTLTESNVVRAFASAGDWTGAAVQLDVPRPAGEMAAVIVQGEDGSILGVAREASPQG